MFLVVVGVHYAGLAVSLLVIFLSSVAEEKESRQIICHDHIADQKEVATFDGNSMHHLVSPLGTIVTVFEQPLRTLPRTTKIQLLLGTLQEKIVREYGLANERS